MKKQLLKILFTGVLGVSALAACEPYGVDPDMNVARIQGCWESLNGGKWMEVWWNDDNYHAYSYETYEWDVVDSAYVLTDEGMLNQSDSLTVSSTVLDGMTVVDRFSVTLTEPNRILVKREGTVAKNFTEEFTRINRMPFQKKAWYDISPEEKYDDGGEIEEGGDSGEGGEK